MRTSVLRTPFWVIFAACTVSAPAAAQTYDLLVRGGRVVDGSGSPWYRADVGTVGDTIVAIGRHLDGSAKRVLDAGGRIVSPGFIDIHTHANRGLFDVPTADNYVRQGVTTVFAGQDGGSPVPLRPFLEQVASTPLSLNFGSFIGQGDVRRAVLGNVDRAATAEEINRMQELVRQGMRDGAFGMSTGLFYVPGAFASTEELVALAHAAGEMGGIHISHMRDEASKILESVEETVRIGEEGGLPTQVTHHKVIGPAYWGGSVDTLRLVDEARARGVDVTLDQYPYTASATRIQAALWPKWAQAGDREAVLARLREPATRARIRTESARIIRDERGGGDASRVQISACDWDPSLAGETLAEITRSRGLEPSLENAADTVIWIVEQADVGESSTPSGKRIWCGSSATRPRWSPPTAASRSSARRCPIREAMERSPGSSAATYGNWRCCASSRRCIKCLSCQRNGSVYSIGVYSDPE